MRLCAGIFRLGRIRHPSYGILRFQQYYIISKCFTGINDISGQRENLPEFPDMLKKCMEYKKANEKGINWKVILLEKADVWYNDQVRSDNLINPRDSVRFGGICQRISEVNA